MKLKDTGILPEKAAYPNVDLHPTRLETYNKLLDQIGEIEIPLARIVMERLDVEKLEALISSCARSFCRSQTTIVTEEDCFAQSIIKAMPELLKEKK